MKYVLAALGVALALAVAANVWQAVPAGAPAKTDWQQRVEQLLDATNVGDFKAACDAAPTAVYSATDFVLLALQSGVSRADQLEPLCEKLLRGSTTKLDNKTPIGLTYKILYVQPDDGKPVKAGDERIVVLSLKWTGVPATVIILHLQLLRFEWLKHTAKCKGKPCAPLRWYVIGS